MFGLEGWSVGPLKLEEEKNPYIPRYFSGERKPFTFSKQSVSPKTVKTCWVKSVKRKILAQYEEEFSIPVAPKQEQ